MTWVVKVDLMDKKLLAVIPARGGSKRIPHKNIKDFLGKAAKESGIFTDIIVSTDDEAIASVAREYGASVPFLRDALLSNDFTGTGPVASDAYLKMKAQGKDYDAICTIYATAPLLTAKHLKEAYEIFNKDHVDYLFSCCEFPFPFQRGFYKTEAGAPDPVMPECIPMRSQDLPKAYQDAGQFYFKSIEYTLYEGLDEAERAKRDPYKDFVCRLYEMPRYRVIDIDTPEDWEYALILAEAIKKLNYH